VGPKTACFLVILRRHRESRLEREYLENETAVDKKTKLRRIQFFFQNVVNIGPQMAELTLYILTTLCKFLSDEFATTYKREYHPIKTRYRKTGEKI